MQKELQMKKKRLKYCDNMDKTKLKLEVIKIEHEKDLNITNQLIWLCMFTFGSLAVLYYQVVINASYGPNFQAVILLNISLLFITAIMIFLVIKVDRTTLRTKQKIESLYKKKS